MCVVRSESEEGGEQYTTCDNFTKSTLDMSQKTAVASLRPERHSQTFLKRQYFGQPCT
jgi:hypothetical protein